MTNPHSLLARLYKGMYHPHHSFLHAGTGNRVSFGWRSIQQGKELLQQGLRVRIGNGQNTRIWSDPWLPTLPPRPASGPILDVNMTVADLWKEGKREWDPVVFEGITPKIRHFLWRGLSGALATATQLRTRTIPADPVCQKCCQEEETVNHILFTCPFANAVWRHVYSLVGQIRFSFSLEDNLRRLLLRATHPSLNTSQRLVPFWIMWRLWKSRNDFLFQKLIRSPQIEANKGVHEANEWIEANSNDEATRIDQTSQNRVTDRGSQWQPPPSGWLKCNFDSGFMQGRTFTNTGWIIRDSDGKVILSGCAKLQSAKTPLQAEALGFLHVLHVVWAHGMRQICFEGDNKELISIINHCEDHSSIGSLLYDIRHWMAKLPLSSLDHINRERNSAADKMAQHTLTISSLYHLYSVPPLCLIPHLYKPYTI
ncbi:unnamed protein product [Arabidopsis halleri]